VKDRPDHDPSILHRSWTRALIGVINRIQVEERALHATLGDAYASYAAGRKRLVPLVW